MSFTDQQRKSVAQVCLLMVAVIALYAGSFWVHRQVETLSVSVSSADAYRVIPSPEVLKPFTLGYRQLVADYMWIRAISYFADHLRTDRHYPLLYAYLDLITELDPKFKWPYYFGGIILGVEAKQFEDSNRILKKGMREHPGYWKFPFYLGFNYWFYYNDSLKAAAYLEQAAKLPNAPTFLRTFPATLYSDTNQTQAAIRFLREIQRSIPDSSVAAGIERRIKAIAEGDVKRSHRKQPGPPRSGEPKEPR